MQALKRARSTSALVVEQSRDKREIRSEGENRAKHRRNREGEEAIAIDATLRLLFRLSEGEVADLYWR
jgi:hypothetical protein